MPTTLKSVRLPDQLIADVEQFQGNRSFNRVVRASLKLWLKRRKRKSEDALITQALASRSPEQVSEEEQIVRLSGKSVGRILREGGL